MLGKRVLSEDADSKEPAKLLDFTTAEDEPQLEGPHLAPIVLPNLPFKHPELLDPESVNQQRLFHNPLVPANSPMDEQKPKIDPNLVGENDEALLESVRQPNTVRDTSSEPNPSSAEKLAESKDSKSKPAPNTSKFDRLRGFKSFLEDRINTKPQTHPATQCPELFPLGLRLETPNHAGENPVLIEPTKADGRSNQSTNATPQSVSTLEFIVSPSEPLVKLESTNKQTSVPKDSLDSDECYKRFFEDFSAKHVNLPEIFEIMSIAMESVKQKIKFREEQATTSESSNPSKAKSLLLGMCSRNPVIKDTQLHTEHKQTPSTCLQA